MVRMYFCLALMLVAVFGVPAHAQSKAPADETVTASEAAPAGTTAKTMTGVWEYSNARRDKSCTLTFLRDSPPGGSKLEFGPTCAAVFPSLKSAAAWSLGSDDLLRCSTTRATS